MKPVRWSTEDVPRSQWLDAVDELLWNASGMRVHRQAGDTPAPAEVGVWQAGPFVLQTGRTEAGLVVSRTREALHATTDDHYWLYQALGPVTLHAFPSKQLEARPGELLLGCADTVFVADGSQGFHNRVVFIPRPMLDSLLKEPNFKDGFTIDAEASALVCSCLDALWPMLPSLDEATVEANLHAIMALLAVAIGASGEGTEAGRQAYRTALIARAQRFIEMAAHDPSVTPARVAAALKLSVRQLHRMFASTGRTVAERISDARLDQSARLLADLGAAELRIADVAYRCGFDSLATFHRAFRARYDCSPGDYRERALSAPRTPSEPSG